MANVKEYKNRTYRRQFDKERWQGFAVEYKETDVWISIDKHSFHVEMPEFAEKTIRSLREMMDIYLCEDPNYALSLTPYSALPNSPLIVRQMSKAAREAGVGPMAAVAGAFAEHIAKELKKQFYINEIFVENGGDIYADIKEDLDVCVFAGESPLSEKIGLRIEAMTSDSFGICTSSGIVGHSLSFGKADAVMIVCKDAMLADAYATAFANRIQTIADLNPILKEIACKKDILSAMLVKDDKLGVIGCFELKIFK